MGERPILSALQKMLCQMCYLMLTISMALVRLLAAGLTAAADIVDANIVDIPHVAPRTLLSTTSSTSRHVPTGTPLILFPPDTDTTHSPTTTLSNMPRTPPTETTHMHAHILTTGRAMRTRAD